MHFLLRRMWCALFLDWPGERSSLTWVRMTRFRRACLLIGICSALAGSSPRTHAGEPQPVAFDSKYRGWKTLCLLNGLVELQVLPEIGGRIIQFKVGGKEFLWVNPQLAGKYPT